MENTGELSATDLTAKADLEELLLRANCRGGCEGALRRLLGRWEEGQGVCPASKRDLLDCPTCGLDEMLISGREVLCSILRMNYPKDSQTKWKSLENCSEDYQESEVLKGTDYGKDQKEVKEVKEAHSTGNGNGRKSLEETDSRNKANESKGLEETGCNENVSKNNWKETTDLEDSDSRDKSNESKDLEESEPRESWKKLSKYLDEASSKNVWNESKDLEEDSRDNQEERELRKEFYFKDNTKVNKIVITELESDSSDGMNKEKHSEEGGSKELRIKGQDFKENDSTVMQREGENFKITPKSNIGREKI